MRGLILGVWACAVSLGATYGAAYWRALPPGGETAGHAEGAKARAIKPITIPVIVDGSLKGYVSAEFSFIGAQNDPHGSAMDPESFMMDEAFRLIYADSRTDFVHAAKKDLAALTRQITSNVNQRMGGDVIKETFVKSFTFIPRGETPR